MLRLVASSEKIPLIGNDAVVSDGRAGGKRRAAKRKSIVQWLQRSIVARHPAPFDRRVRGRRIELNDGILLLKTSTVALGFAIRDRYLRLSPHEGGDERGRGRKGRKSWFMERRSRGEEGRESERRDGRAMTLLVLLVR